MRLDGDRAVVVVDLGQRLERRPLARDELPVLVGGGPATSPTEMLRSGAPLAITVPSEISRSSGEISSSLEAMSRIRSRVFSAAKRTALPPMNVPREAKVPVQTAEESVLELSIVTVSYGTPSASATICVWTVFDPARCRPCRRRRPPTRPA
jgi:hypothetical protein